MLYKILVVMSFMPLLTLGFKRNKPLATKGEVCYGHLGCFPFQRPHSEFMRGLFPWTPKRINTAFLLYTRRNPKTFQELIAVKLQTIKDSNFKTSQKTRIIIHGYLSRGTTSWLKTMCKAMLQVEDINCICVNWKGGSLTSYDQAAANIRVVGSEVAYFIQSLKANFNYPPSKVHLIGHSLGAHSAGLAGARVPGIGRITGLDPAKPNFQGAPTEVRLDPSDALLVDVIHTDASLFYGLGGYGMIQPVGHLDFYPNGGKKMPGCKKEIKNGGLKVQMSISCSHSRAYKYYTESIGNPNGFLAYPATSFDAFQKGAGFPCRSGGCPLMGHSAEDYSNITSTTQLFYLNTGAKKNFSSWRYKVTVDVAGSNQVIGSFSVSLQVSNRTTKFHEIHKGQINQGRQYTQFIDVEIDAGVISGVMFVWNSDNWTIFWKRLGASSVTVQSGKDGSVYTFCDSKVMKKNVKQTLKPCK